MEKIPKNKLSLVVRKVQEGKTTICIAYIMRDITTNIHIVITMNALVAGMQFLGRMKQNIGQENIIVFNSSARTADGCHHAKSVNAIFDIIERVPSIKVIVCCAHFSRIRTSIPDIILSASERVSSRGKTRKFVIHIDEAHAYIPRYRDNITDFNDSPLVAKIIGYSASPDPIWSPSDGEMFKSILICDVEKDLGIIHSAEYFGVKNCVPIISTDTEEALDLLRTSGPYKTTTTISDKVLILSGDTKYKTWYGRGARFSIGDECLYLNYITSIIPTLNIKNDEFSYNFVPAYFRKATQYEAVIILLKTFRNANVIVVNSEGIILYRKDSKNRVYKVISGNALIKKAVKSGAHKKSVKLLEPAFVIREMIKGFPNCPVFITGYTCIGMSMTLIDEHIGNFDNAIMPHLHLLDNREQMYQFCRFVFNYANWSPKYKNKIKKTNLFALTREIYNICIEYETHIETLSGDTFAGKYAAILESESEAEAELELESSDS